MPKPHRTLSKPNRTLESILLAGLGALAATDEEGTKFFSRLVERGQRAFNRTPPVVRRRIGFQELVSDVRLEIMDGRVEIIKSKVLKKRSGVRPGLAVEAVEALSPPTASAKAETTHLRRNADARAAFLDEFGTLTSREVADYAGSSAANRAALANRWKAEGRVFAVEAGGKTRFPAFQFSDDDGHPRPVLAEILKILQPRLSGWQTALWFTGRNGWLGAKRPVDVLASDPTAVVEAARQEAEAFD
jgi:hypothetical protein